MANPIEFKEQNLKLGAPKGQEGKVGSLPAFRGKDEFVSCWELTPEELEEVKQTGRVYLHVNADAHPPVYVNGNYPFKDQNNSD